MALRQFSASASFYIPGYAHPTKGVSWEEVAPLDKYGKPLGRREALGVVDSYDHDARAKEEVHESLQQDRLQRGRMERAKRNAWKQYSEKHRSKA